VAPFNSSLVSSWQLFPFEVESNAPGAEEVLTRSLFLPIPGQPWAYLVLGTDLPQWLLCVVCLTR
jgi:hypothetical protein